MCRCFIVPIDWRLAEREAVRQAFGPDATVRPRARPTLVREAATAGGGGHHLHAEHMGQDGEDLHPRTTRAEALMIGLPTGRGAAAAADFRPQLDRFEHAGLTTRKACRMIPTRQGIDLHNQVALAVL